MQWTWFDLTWPWIGLGLSGLLFILLFATNVLRGDVTRSRWFDPVWLAWLAPAAYMIHQFEEYGIDAQGVRFAFPNLLSASLGMPPFPDSPLPTALFVAINIPAIWITGLVCGLLSWRHPFVGLGVYAIHFTNSFSHLGSGIATSSYNPGMLASGLISLPLSLWVFYACFIRGSMRWRGMAILTAAGVLFTVTLLVAIKLFAKGYLSVPLLLAIQALNPLWVIVIPWMFEKSVLGKTRPAENSPGYSSSATTST